MTNKEIKKMVDKYPNNMELGKEIRSKVWDEAKQWRVDQFNRNRAPEEQVSTIDEMEEKVSEIYGNDTADSVTGEPRELYIFESPDGGKSVTRRKAGDENKEMVERVEQMSLFGEGNMEVDGDNRAKGYTEEHTKEWLNSVSVSNPDQLELFPEVEKKLVSWDEYEIMIDKLVVWIKYGMDKEVGAIYGVPRGGLPIAVELSHRLGIPLLMNYADKKVVAKGKKVLVVDDIADTGHTLLDFDNPSNVVVTLHYHKQSKVIPDFYVEEKGDDWIVYPWETVEEDAVQDYLKS
jgi:hypoxanthine phosphoribosyltransferase